MRSAQRTSDFEAFVAALPLRAPRLCPELRLHLADDLDAVWDLLARRLGPGYATVPPYWAVAWPAGEALARHLLDHPSLVRNKSVLDLGTGSGLCAIAASACGATRVEACDIDANARVAATLNARVNGCAFRTIDAPQSNEHDWDVVVAADIWYERFSSAASTAWLRQQSSAGTLVLLSDTGRAFRPRRNLRLIDRTSTPVRAPGGEMVTPAIFELESGTAVSERDSTSALGA